MIPEDQNDEQLEEDQEERPENPQKVTKEVPEQSQTQSAEQDMNGIIHDAYKRRIDEIRNAWKYKRDSTTLPVWAQVEDKTRPHREAIEVTKNGLGDVDEETKNMIIRQLLLTLRCNSCERARSAACHFSVCIRGLLSGRDIGGL